MNWESRVTLNAYRASLWKLILVLSFTKCRYFLVFIVPLLSWYSPLCIWDWKDMANLRTGKFSLLGAVTIDGLANSFTAVSGKHRLIIHLWGSRTKIYVYPSAKFVFGVRHRRLCTIFLILFQISYFLSDMILIEMWSNKTLIILRHVLFSSKNIKCL
jgi:hypothetical protein